MVSITQEVYDSKQSFLEVTHQAALAASSEPDARVTSGDIRRQHQALSRCAEIAQIFDLPQHGFELETIYQRLAA